MKLNILSDLHLGQAGLACPDTAADAVILAGDIARPAQAIAWARGLGKPVLYVPATTSSTAAAWAAPWPRCGRWRPAATCRCCTTTPW